MLYFVQSLCCRKAAIQIGKTLKSALANAEHNQGLSADQLIVKKCDSKWWTDDEGYRPRARGSGKSNSEKQVILPLY